MLAIGKPNNLPSDECGFSDVTLIGLIHLILEMASHVGDGQETDLKFQRELDGIAQQDAFFSEWLLALRKRTSQPLSTSGQYVSSQYSSNDVSEPRIDQVSVKGIGWQDFIKAVIGLNQSSVLAGLAKQAASAVLRLKLLQTRFQKELEASRLESIYQLAYGLSHELNNPLANIAARSGILLSNCQNHDHRLLLETIIDNASRGSEMIGDLMLLARPPRPNIKTVSLDSLSLTCEKNATHWARLRGLTFEQKWQQGLIISTDASMLSEAIWALLRNAIEASPPNGTISLTAWKDADQFKILIADEGTGLNQEAMQRCFDPYYSGREAGRGLGMGLSKAKRFAQALGGDVTLVNQSIGGCQATIWIPA